MAPRLPDLNADQVEPLYDALLANADRLLSAALAVLDAGQIGLARSLGTLGLEESAKAIAIFERRIEIAYEPEGTPFVNRHLRDLWRFHNAKLKTVHRFLVDEAYWFGVEVPHHPLLDEPVETWSATIDRWAAEDNVAKQNGFYVDVAESGELLLPIDETDAEAVRAVLGQVHQIGWQLRLGEHIEAKGQAQSAADTPPASDEDLARYRELYARADIDPEHMESILASMAEGAPGRKLHNDAFRLHLPGADVSPFAHLGKPGYEAQTREIHRLALENGLIGEDPEQ